MTMTMMMLVYAQYDGDADDGYEKFTGVVDGYNGEYDYVRDDSADCSDNIYDLHDVFQ